MSSSHSESQNQEEDKSYCYAMYQRLNEIFCHALSTSSLLGLFDIISEGGCLTASEITCHLQVKNPDFASHMIDRLLRLLACNQLLISSNRVGQGQRQYQLSSLGELFVRNKSNPIPVYTSQDASFTQAWLKLKDAIIDGDNLYEKAFGGAAYYESMKSDPESVKIFNEIQNKMTSYIMKNFVYRYNGFEGIKSLVDVGGGTGLSLGIILSKYPQIDAINFDLPEIIKDAPSYPGVKHVGGDMFLKIPTADAILMKDVLHNWDDERCIKILKNCYDALPKGGKAIVIAHVMPEVLEPNIANKYICQMDVLMFMLPGGMERTEKEHKALGKAAGFSGVKLISHAVVDAIGIIEFYK